MTIRSAVPRDAATLSEFAERTFRDTFGPDNTLENMDLYVAGVFGVERQHAELADPRGSVLLIELNASVVGYAQMTSGAPPHGIGSTPAIELQRFYIAQEYHGLGLAQRLMRRTLDTAFEHDAKTLWLGVWERNARAISFYRKLGFADVGAHVFMLGNDQQIDRIMSRTTRD